MSSEAPQNPDARPVTAEERDRCTYPEPVETQFYTNAGNESSRH
jgi:hypothetical protein